MYQTKLKLQIFNLVGKYLIYYFLQFSNMKLSNIKYKIEGKETYE